MLFSDGLPTRTTFSPSLVRSSCSNDHVIGHNRHAAVIMPFLDAQVSPDPFRIPPLTPVNPSLVRKGPFILFVFHLPGNIHGGRLTSGTHSTKRSCQQKSKPLLRPSPICPTRLGRQVGLWAHHYHIPHLPNTPLFQYSITPFFIAIFSPPATQRTEESKPGRRSTPIDWSNRRPRHVAR